MRGIDSDPPPQESNATPDEASYRFINYRLAFGSLGALAVLVAASVWWHARQESQAAKTLLDSAAQAESEENWSTAAALLRAYLLADPKNPDATFRLAQAVERGAQSAEEMSRAISIYAQLTHDDPTNAKYGLALAELQFVMSLPEGASRSVQQVLAHEPDNPKAIRLQALILDDLTANGPVDDPAAYGRVAQKLEQALERDGGDIMVAARLATLYRRHGVQLAESESFMGADQLRDRADRIVDQMVRSSSDNGEAYLARYVYRFENGLLPPRSPDSDSLDADVAKALELLPDHLEANLAAVEYLINQQLSDDLLNEVAPTRTSTAALQRAAECAAKAIAKRPSDPRGYRALSYVRWRAGRDEEAIDTLRQGIGRTGLSFDPVLNLNVFLAELLIVTERWSQAAGALKMLSDAVARARVRAESRDAADAMQATADLLWARWYGAEANPDRSLIRALAAG